MKKEVLFICQGNVGRSQMAEGFYNAYTNSRSAISAGLQDLSELTKYNGHPAVEIIEVMLERGIDVSQQVIKQLTKEMILEAEKIVILCERGLLPPFLIISHFNIEYSQVQDPYQTDGNTHREIRNQIEEIVLTLLEKRNEN